MNSKQIGADPRTAINMGEIVNTKNHELCPIVSPDGKYLFFLSNRNRFQENYWISAEFIESFENEVLNNQ